jgi:hypothetical protein
LSNGVVGFRRFSSLVIAVAALAILEAGCASPYTYGTPRTLPPGTTSHTFGMESIGAFAKLPADQFGMRAEASGGFYLLPSYTVRIGVGERSDIGLRTSSAGIWAGLFGADLKLHLLKSRWVDVAANPMGQLVIGFGAHVHLPRHRRT